jgi:hypothetical protein
MFDAEDYGPGAAFQLFNLPWHVSETQPRGSKQSRQGFSWRAIIQQEMGQGDAREKKKA